MLSCLHLGWRLRFMYNWMVALYKEPFWKSNFKTCYYVYYLSLIQTLHNSELIDLIITYFLFIISHSWRWQVYNFNEIDNLSNYICNLYSYKLINWTMADNLVSPITAVDDQFWWQTEVFGISSAQLGG